MVNIGLDFWLTQWNLEPSILIGTALITGLYLYAVGPIENAISPKNQYEQARPSLFFQAR